MHQLISVLAFTAILVAAEPPWTAPASDVAAVQAIVAKMVELGYPDTRGSALTIGSATVNAKVDSTKQEPPLPMRLSTTQATDAGPITTYTFRIRGLHARLADGSWLLGMRYRLVPREGIEVSVTGDVVEASTEFATAKAARSFTASVDAAKYVASIAPERRASACAIMDATVPVSYHLKLGANDLPLATIILSQAGCPDAPLLAWSIAEQRAHDYWQQRYWLPAAPPFDPTGAYAWAGDTAKAWTTANPAPAVESPADALRRALHREARAWLLSPAPSSVFTADAAAAVATVLLDPGDPQGHAPRVAALREALRIPAEPAADAPVVERLRRWGAPSREPDFRVTGGGGKDGSVSMSTTFVRPKEAYVPARDDLDQLVAHLGNAEPSRFQDFGGTRTVGDNALRAMAAVLGEDPRGAVGRDVQAPWNEAERLATAKALQAWWTNHRDEVIRTPTAK